MAIATEFWVIYNHNIWVELFLDADTKSLDMCTCACLRVLDFINSFVCKPKLSWNYETRTGFEL